MKNLKINNVSNLKIKNFITSIKNDLNKWRNVVCSWNTAISHNLSKNFNAVAIKISNKRRNIFIEIQGILKRNIVGTSLPAIKIYY